MRDRVRTDNGEHSEWFDISQGLRQECVLSPLRFTTFFAAVIHAVLVCFSEDPDIARDLVYLGEHLKEDGVKFDPLSCVRSMGHTVRGRCRPCVYVGGRPCEHDECHCDRFRSRRPHRVRNEDGDHAAVFTEPGTPDLTACHRSSRTYIYIYIYIDRRCRFCTWAVLSPQALTLCQISHGGPGSQ